MGGLLLHIHVGLRHVLYLGDGGLGRDAYQVFIVRVTVTDANYTSEVYLQYLGSLGCWGIPGPLWSVFEIFCGS